MIFSPSITQTKLFPEYFFPLSFRVSVDFLCKTFQTVIFPSLSVYFWLQLLGLEAPLSSVLQSRCTIPPKFWSGLSFLCRFLFPSLSVSLRCMWIIPGGFFFLLLAFGFFLYWQNPLRFDRKQVEWEGEWHAAKDPRLGRHCSKDKASWDAYPLSLTAPQEALIRTLDI